MWKWLGGCLLLVVLLVVGGMWYGYRTMQDSLSADGSARVTIGATPARVFASLANGDSVPTWMAEGNTVTTTRRGPLAVGDTLRIQMRATIGMPQQRLAWKVAEVVPDSVLVLQLVTDTSTRLLAIRRDSLTAKGDSTVIVSRVASPLMDSLQRAQQDPKGESSGGLVGATSDILLTMFSMQAKLDLDRLKRRIEHGPAPAPGKR